MVDFLTGREAAYCEAILAEFERQECLPALTRSVRDAGLSTATMPLLFELRFAKSLKDRNLAVEYERPTVGATSVDFAYGHVLAELVSISASEAVRRGTQQHVDDDGIHWSQLLLATDNDDARLSEEGEVLLVQQKITEKVFRDGQPVKFPLPADPGPYHVIVVDMRGFLGGDGGDHGDCIQLAYGNPHVGEFLRRYWTDPQTGQRVPIRGLYEDTPRPRGAPVLRARIHGILFTRDTSYVDGGLMATALLAHNPHLITTQPALDALRAAVLD